MQFTCIHSGNTCHWHVYYQVKFTQYVHNNMRPTFRLAEWIVSGLKRAGSRDNILEHWKKKDKELTETDLTDYARHQ